MDNLWITSGDQLVRWTARLGGVEDPERLLEWLLTVVGAGERHRVHEVLAAPASGFDAGRDGALADVLARRFAEGGTVDLGHFGSSGVAEVDGARLRASALVAHADARGEVVEEPVEDLGALLRELRPADAADSPTRMLDCPPLWITGPLVDPARPPAAGVVAVRFVLRSDIWFPWVVGFLSDDFDGVPHHDNRPLARLHTPRLNAFLGEVREATLAAGGVWELDEEIRFTRPGIAHEGGIDLDAPRPVG